MHHREAAGWLGRTRRPAPTDRRHAAIEGHRMVGERPLDPLAPRGRNVREYQMLIGSHAHADFRDLFDDMPDRAPIAHSRLVAHPSARNHDPHVVTIAAASLAMPSQMI